MLLAAGLGTRLRPVTETLPKCMVDVAGKPVLEHVVEWLRGEGVTDLVINLHYRPELVRDHFGDGTRFGVRIAYSFEPELLGTAGAVGRVGDDLTADGTFLVVYADNLFDLSLAALLDRHRAAGATLTVAVTARDDVTSSGMIELDDAGRIRRIVEKPAPEQVTSHLINAGLYACEPAVLAAIPAGFSDFARDVLPAMLAAGATVAAYQMREGESFRWIDTSEDLDATRAFIGATDLPAPVLSTDEGLGSLTRGLAPASAPDPHATPSPGSQS